MTALAAMKRLFDADDPRHGTYAGAQAHRRRRETPCDACKAAQAAYMREHRKSPTSTHRERTNAQSRALWRLAAIHHDDYERLYIEEYRKATSQPRPDAVIERRPA